MRETAIVTAMLMAACATHAAETTETELPDMVVTPTGQDAAPNQLGHSLSVITADQIEANGWRSLPEALRSLPGLHVVQSGAPGSTVSLFLRGSRTSHVLVLIDGIRVNDPSGPTREAYIGGIDLANVARIEVVRGPQSGLYGADAIAGVINIITKESREGTAGSVSAEAGSYDTYRVKGEMSARKGAVSGSASVAYLESRGFSSASERFPGNEESDGMDSLNVSARVGVTPSETVSIEATARYIEWMNEYDAGSGPAADADGNVAETEQVLAGIRARLGAPTARWQQSVHVQYSTSERTFEDSWGTSTFDGENWEAEFRNDVAVSESHNVSVGVSYRDETAKASTMDSVSADNIGVYAQHSIGYGAFDAVASVRHDEHQTSGGEVTYRVAPSIAIEKSGTRLRGSVGTGFKAPSLYQLHAPASAWGSVGNADLRPETSLGWDAGVEQVIVPEILSFGVTYFASDVEDLIEFVNGYQNVSEVEIRGVEVLASLTPTDRMTVDVSYTYTDSENQETDEQLIRIPNDRASLAISYAITPRARVSATALYVSARNDSYFDASMFTSLAVKTAAYTVVNLAGSVDISDTVTLFGRIDNVFDETYEEVYGYGTAGVSGYGGVKVAL
jgi:vitamin B12 transporter